MSASGRWRPEPTPVAADAIPEVRIHEVGPRDGLQAESVIVPTDVKVAFCRRLRSAGTASLEATGFVSARWVPQLADADEVVAGLGLSPGDGTSALIVNRRGLDRARDAGLESIAVVASTTDSFAAANLNTTRDGSMTLAGDLAGEAGDLGLGVRGYLSMSFGDPWEGPVDIQTVAALAGRLYDSGCATIALGDTIGVGTPSHVARVIDAVIAAGVPAGSLAMHFHDTYGQGLANVVAALERGVREFDSSAGGLGRCPYAPGATGNLATEDLVWMLEGMGVDTGLDLDSLVQTSLWMADQLGLESVPSRVVTALGRYDAAAAAAG